METTTKKLLMISIEKFQNTIHYAEPVYIDDFDEIKNKTKLHCMKYFPVHENIGLMRKNDE